jgi:hypothetical protein
LRKTIARVANIGQAASIGGLNVEKLVNMLSEKVGQSQISQLDENGTKYNTECPTWFDKKHITKTIDISEMLSRDEQPVHEVLSLIKKLGENEILEIIAPFIPAPLLDKSLSLDHKHWLESSGESEFRVYFLK